jgi:hypothetical protein
MTVFPPVPSWIPTFQQPLDQIAERFRFYSNGTRDFVIFEHGTCVIVENGATDEAAATAAIETLSQVFHYHPDMNPMPMKDGNVLIQYNHPAINVVLSHVAEANWPEIELKHLDGLTPDEVLITPLGQNVFDDFGKKALLGRTFFFQDAQHPKVVRVERADR